MTINFQDDSINNHFYAQQIKKHMVQFMAVFTGLHVSIGKNDFNSQTDLIRVPIRYGTSDRVVDHIISENTQNKMLRLPMMGANILNLSVAPDLRKGVGTTKRNVVFPRGGNLPDDLLNIVKAMPVPYEMRLELSLMASNQEQMLQMLEQILLLFDPTLQLQLSDDYMDWGKITTIKLEDIIFDRNLPAGTSKQLMVSSLEFTMPVYLSQPVDIKKNIVKSIQMRLDVIGTAEDIEQAVCDITNDTEIATELFNIDDFDIPAN